MTGRRVAESWSGFCTAGEELIDKIRLDLAEKYSDLGYVPTEKFCLFGVEIRDSNNGQYQIGQSVFEVKDGILSIFLGEDADGFIVRSIIPKQSGNISVYYFR